MKTRVDNGGQVTVTLDEQPIAGNTQFSLPSDAGGHRALQVALVGPIGASCVVELAVVDGGSDGDFLLCQAHSPAPVHSYSFSVAAQAALQAFAGVKGGKT